MILCAASIYASARGVKGIGLLLAADPRIGKVWLDQSPSSLRAALGNTLTIDLFEHKEEIYGRGNP